MRKQIEDLFNRFYSEEKQNRLSSFAIQSLLNQTLSIINENLQGNNQNKVQNVKAEKVE